MAIYRKTTELSKIYRGNTEINKIYRGQTQVYSVVSYPYITDNLILSLDVTDSNSYPGSGTTWTDLSDNGYNVTLYNGVTYDSGNGGHLIFDGSNDYGAVNSVDIGSTNFTIEFWGRSNSTSQTAYANILDFEHSISGGTGGWVIQQANTSNNNFYFAFYDGSGYQSNGDAAVFSLSTSSWEHIVITKNGTSITIYENGSNNGNGWTASSSNFPGQTQRLRIASWWAGGGGGRYMNMDFGAIRIYSVALNSSQVLSNYNNTNSNY